MADRTIRAVFLGDATQLIRTNQQVEMSLSGMDGAFSKVAQTAAGFLSAQILQGGAQRLQAFVGDSIRAASSLGESLNAVEKIFGDSAPRILEWGEANATSFGLSQRAFNQMATPMGAVLKNLGFEQDVVAESTINLTKRAADMASVFDTDVEEALAAINSALRGEANPIERYGVSVTAAAVAQRALADTGKTSATALTENEKAAARLAIIFEQTESVAGDFAATSDTLANKSRIAAAEAEKQQAIIGEKLLPVMLKWTEAKMALMDAFTLVIPLIEAGANAIVFLADNGEYVAGVIAAVATVMTVTYLPAMVASIAASWAFVAALGAQAVAFAIANPLLAAAGLAAGAATIAFIKMNVATGNTEKETTAAALDVQNLGAEMEGADSAAWSAARALDVAADSASGLSQEARDLAGALGKVTSTSLAAGYAASIYSAELAGAEAASADAYTAAVEHVRGLLLQEEALGGIEDALIASAGWTDRYTASNDRTTTASRGTSAALKEQKQALEEIERAAEKAAARNDSLAASFARLGDQARADTLGGYEQRLRAAGVGAEEAAAIAAAAAAGGVGSGVPQQAMDLINAALAKGTIDAGTAIRLTNAAQRGTPDPLMVELGLVPGLASGGIVRARSGGTLALLGEGGQDEAVVPLPRGGGGFGGNTYHIYVLDQDAVVRTLVDLERTGRIAQGVTVGV